MSRYKMQPSNWSVIHSWVLSLQVSGFHKFKLPSCVTFSWTQLPVRSRDEEIALLEQESEEEEEKGEGEGKGGGEKEASDGTNTDDELLNL